MRKALTITLVAALALFAGSAAYANYCARDVVPASTILVPYVVNAMESDYKSAESGYTTLLTITNVSADAQIIHITVWNALSVPVLDFNETLTGYDVWQINFRDMLDANFCFFDTNKPSLYDKVLESHTRFPNNGVNPSKEDADQGLFRQPFEWGPDGRSTIDPDPPDDLPLPETAGDLATTACFMPYGCGRLDLTNNIKQLRNPIKNYDHASCGGETLRPDFDNDWLSTLGDDWGLDLFYYVTVDVVDQCNFAFPESDGYFVGFYENVNVLIGDIIYLNQADNFSEAINAVHIETDPPNGASGIFNFYEERAWDGDPTGVDQRPALYLEPLATAFAFNYYDISDWNISTQVMLWKNKEDIESGKVDDCGYYMYYSWDFDEHTESRSGSCEVSPCDPNDIDPNEFPFETQSVPVNQHNFDLVGTSFNQQGWLLFIFPPSYINTGVWDDPSPGGKSRDAQNEIMAWMGVKYYYEGYSTALEAATLANYHCFDTQQLQQLGVNYDGDGNGAPTE